MIREWPLFLTSYFSWRIHLTKVKKSELNYLGETVWQESYLTGDIYSNVHPNAVIKRVGHLIGGYKEKSANQLKYTPCLSGGDRFASRIDC